MQSTPSVQNSTSFSTGAMDTTTLSNITHEYGRPMQITPDSRPDDDFAETKDIFASPLALQQTKTLSQQYPYPDTNRQQQVTLNDEVLATVQKKKGDYTVKLQQMINVLSGVVPQYMHWNASGDAFYLCTNLSEDILGKFFPNSKFASFRRQIYVSTSHNLLSYQAKAMVL